MANHRFSFRKTMILQDRRFSLGGQPERASLARVDSKNLEKPRKSSQNRPKIDENRSPGSSPGAFFAPRDLPGRFCRHFFVPGALFSALFRRSPANFANFPGISRIFAEIREILGMRPPPDISLDSAHAVFCRCRHVRQKTRESTRKNSTNRENPPQIDLKSVSYTHLRAHET